jgi:predicted RNA-binding Zn-ribbon protein involved in translation (DUF1610 family)
VSDHRILVFDVETAPMLAYIFQAKTEYVPAHAITHEVFMLTWAAKWTDRPKVYGDKLTSDEAIAQDDRRLVAGLAALLRQADAVVAHNGDRFDLPIIRQRLLLQQEEPLGPVRSVDTLKLARKSFRLASNKLDYLARQLGVPAKIGTSFDLWRRCYQGDEKALAAMLRYNRRDVTVLQDVFERLAPYVLGLPRLVDAEHGGEMVCPSCGGGPLQRRGKHRTNASTFQRWHCQTCGRWCRSRTSDPELKVGPVPL